MTESNDNDHGQTEPTTEALAEMPELHEPRFRRRRGRGHHAQRSLGNIVVVDDDLWEHRRRALMS